MKMGSILEGFAPPLIIKKDEVDFVVNKISEALSD
jgi:adenosylmethionine-8-amino-7-oxononanoate aminotransferase